MREPIVAAVIQMCSTADKVANLRAAEALITEAVRQSARLIVLPEMFNCLTDQAEMVRQAEPVPGPTSRQLAQWAEGFGITLVGGSFLEQGGPDGRAYNTSLVYNRRGELLSRYRKLHLFDVDIPDKVTFRESAYIHAGDEICSPMTEAGRLGQSICYDLRFPELYRRLADRGADILTVPSAFAAATGRAHWEILLRARAIENQAYVLAPNQCGTHSAALTTWGQSLIVDPWGGILGQLPMLPDSTPAGTGATPPLTGVVTAELQPEVLQTVRAHLPALTHRRGLERWSRE